MPSRDRHTPNRSRRLEALTLALNSTMNPDRLLDLIIEQATELLHCEAASLLVYDDREDVLRFAAATGVASDQLRELSVPLEGSLAGTIFLENRPLVADQMGDDDRHFSEIDDSVGFRTRMLVGVPMSVDGETTGVLEGINKLDGTFDDEDVELLSVIAAHAGIALRNARQLASLEEANRALQELDVLKSHIMAITSHELRTPLATILGYGDLLVEESPTGLQSIAQHILDAGHRMHDVIEVMTDLLDLLNQNVDAKGFQNVDLVVVLQRVLDELEEADRNRIELDLPAETVEHSVNERYLQHALSHLLKNALRFSEASSAVHVRMKVNHGVVFEIRDEGIGIDEAEIPKIFDAFYQVEHHLDRTYEGLGLGLTMAREVARLHGGRIDVQSAGAGSGASFSLVLP